MQLGGLRPQFIISFSLTTRMDLSPIEFIFAHTSDVKRVIGVMSITINPSIISDDHPASCLSTSFVTKLDICWLNNGNTHPPGLYAGEAPDEKLKINELGPSMQQVMT